MSVDTVRAKKFAQGFGVVTASLSFMASAQATTLSFEDLASGTTLSNQYAGLGVTFAPNALSGPGGPTGSWATNTDMTIASSAGGDVGVLGTPALVSGNVLHSFSGWLNESGDPSLSATFSTPVSDFSADFAGVSTAGDVKILAYNGATLLGSSTGASPGQFTLSFAAPSITRVVILPGSFSDWVGIDNIHFTPTGDVPLPGTVLLMALGLGALGLRLRRS